MSEAIKASLREIAARIATDPKRTLALIALLALVLRFGALVLVPEPHLSTNASISYLGGAHLLVEGIGLKDPSYPLFTPPFYAVVIAGLLELFGTDQLPTKILQIVLDVGTIFLIYLVVRDSFSHFIGLLASAMWAVYPFAIYATLYIGTETMFAFLVVLFAFFFQQGVMKQKWPYFCMAGILLGLATLTRGTTQFLPLLLPGLWFLWPGRLGAWMANCMVCIAAFVLVVLPWSVRNYVVLDDIIPVATAGSVFLWGASDELLTIEERDRELPGFLDRLRVKGIERPPSESKPTVKDRYMIRAAMEHYRERLAEDPVGLGGFFVRKFFRLWYATESGNNHLLVLGLNSPIYVLAIMGILKSLNGSAPFRLFPLSIVMYFVALHVVAFPLFRYVLPIVPFLLVYAAVAVTVAIGTEGDRPVLRIKSPPSCTRELSGDCREVT